MDAGTFWGIIAAARAHSRLGKRFGQLATFHKEKILRYHQWFGRLHAALYRWDVWAAAYLIGGGCSDDAFTDFRAGIIAQGRDWYEKVAASPDNLADHPAVAGAADGPGMSILFDEMVNYAPPRAFERITGAGTVSMTHGPGTGIHASAPARTRPVKVSTSMTHSRCAAVCPGSPQSSCAMDLSERS